MDEKELKYEDAFETEASDENKEREENLKDKKGKEKNIKKEILSWILTFLIAVAIALPIRIFIFEPVRVDGSSMADTLQSKELIFVSKYDYWLGQPQRQDVVICHYPGRTGRFGLPLSFVKRIIGLPGDTVEIRYNASDKQNIVFINGEALDEPYLTDHRNDDFTKTMDARILGEDEYMVMGDNRDNSNDSRNMRVGAIKRDQIVGHVRFVFFPFDEIRLIN